MVTCSATTGPEGKKSISASYSAAIFRFSERYMGSKSELFAVLDLVGRGLLKPVIDCVMPLAQAAAAQERLEKREQFGKIVLQVP